MADVRLLTFPYAGAGTSVFIPLAKALPPWIETWSLQLPGREKKLAKKPITRWNDFETFLQRELHGWTGPKIAIYGHSFGAYACLAAAHVMEAMFSQQSRPSPLSHVFFAAAPAPRIIGDTWFKRLTAILKENNDDAFANSVIEYLGGAPTSFSNAEIRETAIPIMRADLALLLSFNTEKTDALTCKGTAIFGQQDPSMDGQSADQWRHETARNIDVQSIDAGHFFVSTHVAETAALISEALALTRDQ